MKLLVVDDSPIVVEVLSAILKLSGHGVDEAYDGAAVSYTHLTLPTTPYV